jgi:hypothetical protein
MFRPCWGWVRIGIRSPWLTPWATDLSPLGGYYGLSYLTALRFWKTLNLISPY